MKVIAVIVILILILLNVWSYNCGFDDGYAMGIDYGFKNMQKILERHPKQELDKMGEVTNND